jgi:chromosome segregation ATPase
MNDLAERMREHDGHRVSLMVGEDVAEGLFCDTCGAYLTEWEDVQEVLSAATPERAVDPSEIERLTVDVEYWRGEADAAKLEHGLVGRDVKYWRGEADAAKVERNDLRAEVERLRGELEQCRTEHKGLREVEGAMETENERLRALLAEVEPFIGWLAQVPDLKRKVREALDA